MNLREKLKEKKEKNNLEFAFENFPIDTVNTEKIYDIDKETMIKILNSNSDSFTDTSNILKELNNINTNNSEISYNNSYIHDAVDKYETEPENVTDNDVTDLRTKMNINNLLNKNIQLAVLSKENGLVIENYKNNIQETLTKTSITLDQNIHLCINAFSKVKDSFSNTNFSEHIDKLLKIRNEIFDKDIKYVTCIDHILEAISSKDEEITEEILFEILDHHSYLFGQLLGSDMKVKQAYLNKKTLPEEVIRELVKIFKEYVDLSKSYNNSKIFNTKSSKDYVYLYNNIFGSIENYTNVIRTILTSINSIGELSLYKGLSQEEKINKEIETVNKTIINFLKNFSIDNSSYKISEDIESVILTNVFYKKGLIFIKEDENKFFISDYSNITKDKLLVLNNYVLNAVCDNLETVKNINTDFINGFINNVLNYLKNNIPSTDESYNLVSVNIIIKILSTLIDIFKDDIIYKFICIPNMFYNHSILYKKLIECLEGNENENSETENTEIN